VRRPSRHPARDAGRAALRARSRPDSGAPPAARGSRRDPGPPGWARLAPAGAATAGHHRRLPRRRHLTRYYRARIPSCLYFPAMSSNKSRRPPLLPTLAWYLPVLALIAIAVYLVHPLVLILLLLANTLAMAAVCHAI